MKEVRCASEFVIVIPLLAAAFTLDVAKADGDTADVLRRLKNERVARRDRHLRYDPTSMLQELRTTVSALPAEQTDRTRKKNIAFESVVAEGDQAETKRAEAIAKLRRIAALQKRGRDTASIASHGGLLIVFTYAA